MTTFTVDSEDKIQSREDARALIDRVAARHGYMAPETLAAMAPGVRTVVEEALKADRRITSAASVIARKVSKSSIPLIYELLQNAEANNYSRAESQVEDPYISFRVYQDLMVVECNEDGFSEQNVRSLCDIGKSSRPKRHGYIGDKDIGFKSVFKVASKVRIDSGHLSFCLQHQEGESGLGMITPLWTDQPTVAEDHVAAKDINQEPATFSKSTKFVLHFTSSDSSDELERRRNDLVAQLWDLPETVLLFMKKLRKYSVEVFDQAGKQLRRKEVKFSGDIFGPGVRLQINTRDETTSVDTLKRFCLFRREAKGLPKNENRSGDYETSEENVNIEVVLAFPLTSMGGPQIESQKLFAFMPLQDVGFKILIHSDFVTDATRQGIVESSERNIAIRDLICEDLVYAINVHLVNDPFLSHKWMHYLPQSSKPPSSPFWRQLVSKFQEALKPLRLIRSMSFGLGNFHRIDSVRRLLPTQADLFGNPLLPETAIVNYPSRQYSDEDLGCLRDYGLQYLSVESLMPGLITLTCSSEWKTKLFDNRSEDWHSRLSRLILNLCDSIPGTWAGLKVLQLLPLVSREVRDMNSCPSGVYFPTIEGVSIPEDLDIPIILPAAAANPDCRKLYEALGVKTAAPSMIREKIIAKHRASGPDHKTLTPETSNQHLRYLYRMHNKDCIRSEEEKHIIVFDQLGRPRQPKTQYVYFLGEGEFSPGELLVPPFPAGGPADGSGPDVSIIHSVYFENPPTGASTLQKPWKGWLYDFIWIEEKIQLFTKRDSKTDPNQDKLLTPEYIFVIEHWQEKAIGRFWQNFQVPATRKLWDDDPVGTEVVRKQIWICTDGIRRPMEQTFLPVASLVSYCADYVSDTSTLPFIKLEKTLEDNVAEKWSSFAKHFGIGQETNLSMTLAIVKSLADGISSPKDGDLTNTMVKLYLRIHQQLYISSHKQMDRTQIRNFFSTNSCLLASPQSGGPPQDIDTQPPRWVSPDRCLWDAPSTFKVITALRPAWNEVLTSLYTGDQQGLRQFFQDTLCIPDISSRDVIKELDTQSKLGAESAQPEHAENIYELYRLLDRLRVDASVDTVVEIKQAFRSDALIYVPNHTSQLWVRPVDCSWEGHEDEACLKTVYPDLSTLFQDFLGVPSLSIGLTCDRLVELSTQLREIIHIKEFLWTTNTLLTLHPGMPLPGIEDLKSKPIFPVRVPPGATQAMTISGDFLVIDRQRYVSPFKDMFNTLDFAPEEVGRLRALLQWAGLEARCLSKLVSEKTTVNIVRNVEDRDLSRDLDSKARAIASVVSYFQPRPVGTKERDFRTIVQKIQVFRNSEIESTLTVTHNGKDAVALSVRSDLHIQVLSDQRLQIYVPSDHEAREFSAKARLPRAMLACLMGIKAGDVNALAVIVVGNIIQAKKAILGRLLEDQGIPLMVDVEASAQSAVNSAVAGVQPNLPPQPPRPPPILTNPDTASVPYEALLIQAVNAGRTARFPSRDSSFDMATMSQSLVQLPGTTTSFRFFAGDQTDWQRMVGAAGEIFVFELLSNLAVALPDFNRDNWQSTVRRFASAHPEYLTMEPWRGTELSDIFYHDKFGILTALLIEKGYFDEDMRDERPDYYVEVKASMLNQFETPFYMSKYQYARMKSFGREHRDAPQGPRKIYILFRVYGMESGDFQLRVYPDLEKAEMDGELDFEAPSWTVTPRAKASSWR